MRDYGKVKTTAWADEKVRYDMNSDERVLFLYLLTSPHTTALGCFYCPDGYIMEDLQWVPDRVQRAKETLTRLKCALFDRTGWVWLPNFLAHNKPENGSVWRHIRKLAAGVPERVVFRAAVLESVPERENETPSENLTDEKTTGSPEVPSEPNPTEPNRTEPNRTEPSPPIAPKGGGEVVVTSGAKHGERIGRGGRRNRPRSLREALAADEEIRAEVDAVGQAAGDVGYSTPAEIVGRGQGRNAEGLRQIAGVQVRGSADRAGDVQIGGAVRRDESLGGVAGAEDSLRHVGDGASTESGSAPRIVGVEGRQTGAAVVGANGTPQRALSVHATTVADAPEIRVVRLQ